MESNHSDWATTRLIYPDETRTLRVAAEGAGGFSVGEAVVHVNNRGVAVAKQTQAANKKVFAVAVETDASLTNENNLVLIIEPSFPLIRVLFRYSPENLETIADVQVLDADPFAKRLISTKWLDWINNEIEHKMAGFPSSAILDFVINDSIHYWETLTIDTPFGPFLIINASTSIEEILDESDALRLPVTQILEDLFPTPTKDNLRTINQPNIKKKPFRGSSKEAITPTRKSQIKAHFQHKIHKMIEIECPVCFDTVPGNSAVRLFCCHVFCKECMDQYLAMTIRDMGQTLNGPYPFLCPITTCKYPINLSYDQTLSRLLTPSQLKAVVEACSGKRENPIACSLKSCPLAPTCTSQVMKQIDGTSMVYCEECNVTWCEHCLKRISGQHCLRDCNPQAVMDLYSKYKALEKLTVDLTLSVRERDSAIERLARVNERQPWIKQYLIWQEATLSAKKWVLQNAAFCPNCGVGIEKNDGCFHITCIECDTHFCYECGNNYDLEVIYHHLCTRDRVQRLKNATLFDIEL